MPVVIADPHFHNWSAYSQDIDGINSRLLYTVNAFREAADFALQRDKIMFIAGDMFHTRGQIKPSVYNIVKKLINEYTDKGLSVFMLAGNHDCETINAEQNKTALDSLATENCIVFSNMPCVVNFSTYSVFFIPWIEDVNKLKDSIESLREQMKPNDILLIHAVVDGVTSKVGNGLDPEWLYNLPCKLVLAGHLHKPSDYKDKVYSIGSLTHQTFADSGNVNGFIEITPKFSVIRHETKAPKFVDINKIDNSLMFAKSIKGNIVRCTLENVEEKDKKEIEKKLIAMKPLELDIRFTQKTVSVRKEVIASGKISVVDTTNKFIQKQNFAYKQEVIEEAGKILTRVGEQ